jgi:hypothetical protein
MPLIIKILMGGVSIAIAILIIFNLQMDAIKNSDEFYKQGFSSIVISWNSYQGRSVEFHLANGLKVYFWPKSEGKIVIGDSVAKEAGTYLYSIFRKDNNGKYQLLASYDFQRIE